MRRHIVFHIGLAKTGTTAFQHFCRHHRGFLRRHGVIYPRRESGRHGNHAPLVASYIAHRPEGPTVALRWRPRAAAVRGLHEAIEADGAPTALISSEHFSMHFDQSEAQTLAADFGDHDCSVAIVLRDTHARFVSAYNTHVTAGGHLPLEAYARSVLIPGTRYMSAGETVRIWQEAFGRDRIRIIDYDATPDIAAAILQTCGIEAPLPPTAHARRRVSLAPDAVRVLRAANEMIARWQTTPAERSVAAWAQLSLFSILCRRRLGQGTPRCGGWTVGPATLQALDEIADADRRFFAETYAIRLRGDATRARLAVADPPPSDDAERRAKKLVDRVTRGLWTPSEALVALGTWIESRR